MKNCSECGDEIPAQRVKVTKSEYCVHCAEQLEKQGLAPRYRMEILGSSNPDDFEMETRLNKALPRQEATTL